MQITRIIFFFFNRSFFESFGWKELVGGTWFDLVTFCLIGSPFILFHLIPFKFRFSKIYNFVLNSYYYLIIFSSLLLNLIDAEYYRFSHKRSTADLFVILGMGDDIQQEFGPFLRDYGHLLLILVVLIGTLLFLHKKTIAIPKFKNYRTGIIQFLILIPLTILVGRGGISLRPISALDASYFTSPEKVGLVLNTPFTIIKSYGKDQLTDPDFFEKEEALVHFNPYQTSNPQGLFKAKQNVVIVLLESFGAEFVGAAGAEDSFTPFLDSIAQHSLNFQYGIANGKRSIEALPSIYASIPTWMDEAYISSPYNSNKVISIAQLLNNHGYETAFFHGATNGSMKFDSFTQQMGVQHYYGRNEYPNSEDFDGTWGIKDDKFLPWSIEKMNQFKKPFFSMIFTLSSHHPYFIPEEWKGKLKKGKHPLAETIHYTDESLRIFMAKAKKQNWYKNTLFIFLADHTPMPVSKKYANYVETYHIPIIIFDPKGKIKPENSTQYFQQIDLFPTLLDLLDIKTDFFAFGNSFFKNRNEGMSYGEGNYYYFFDQYLLTLQKGTPKRLVNLKNDNESYEDSLSSYTDQTTQVSERVKSMIQMYYEALNFNSTTTE